MHLNFAAELCHCSGLEIHGFGQRRPTAQVRVSVHANLRCADSMTQGSRAFTTVGLPLLALVITGFYGLSTLVQGKFDVQVDLTAC